MLYILNNICHLYRLRAFPLYVDTVCILQVFLAPSLIAFCAYNDLNRNLLEIQILAIILIYFMMYPFKLNLNASRLSLYEEVIILESSLDY